MEFTLVRHVETTGNAENKFAGITETEYTERGKVQFEKLTETLKQIPVDVIYSSPITRALYIAKRVGEDTSTEVKVVEELSEMNFGIFENLTFEEVVRNHRDEWNSWEKDYLNYRIPKGDSLAEFHGRVTQFIDSIKDDDGKVMIICHGGTVQSIITHLLDLQIKDRWHFHIPLGGIVTIRYKSGYGELNELYTPVGDVSLRI